MKAAATMALVAMFAISTAHAADTAKKDTQAQPMPCCTGGNHMSQEQMQNMHQNMHGSGGCMGMTADQMKGMHKDMPAAGCMGMTPEQMQSMHQGTGGCMGNMTPEQRDAMQKQMKEHMQGNSMPCMQNAPATTAPAPASK